MVSYSHDFYFPQFKHTHANLYYFLVARIWDLVKSIPGCYFDFNLYTMNVVNRAIMEHWILLHYLYFKSFEDDSVFERYQKYYYVQERGEMIYQYHKSRKTTVSKKDIVNNFYQKNNIDNPEVINKTSKEFAFATMCQYIDEVQKRGLGVINDPFAETYTHLISRYSYYSSFVHAGPLAVFRFEDNMKETNETNIENELKNTFNTAFIFLETAAGLVLQQTNAPEEEFGQLKMLFASVRIKIKRFLETSIVDIPK